MRNVWDLLLMPLVLLIGSPVVLIPKMTTHATIQPDLMETNSSSSSEHLNSNKESSPRFSLYDNNALGIKISCPADWKPSLKSSTNNFTFVEFHQNTTGNHQQPNPLTSFITLSVEGISDLNLTLDSLTKQNLALAN